MKASIDELVHEHGFEAWASMPIPSQLDPQPFDQLLADGVGDMEWLFGHRELRLHPQKLVDGADHIFTCVLPYQADAVRTDSIQQAVMPQAKIIINYFVTD